MCILDRYLLSRSVTALVKTMLSLVCLFVLIDLLTHRRPDIIKYGVPWYIVLRYYAAFIPEVLVKYQVAALSVLISALLVLGQAAQHNEVTAALSGGISLRRLVRMPILVAAFLAGGVFVMGETLGVYAARDAHRIVNRYFSKNPYRERSGISWANLSGRWTCHIGKFNRLALTGEDVVLYGSSGEVFERIEARRIFWDETEKQWLLEDGRWLEFHPDEDGHPTLHQRRITQCPAPFTEPP
ncbi:MAG TPA: YjgP/YjgQ family permease, partial [Candidatus Hydrogenedentes bacterium]|nr:YjgP/YjgQ family permease [Candidatus Hydrogenedentota bacterium]